MFKASEIIELFSNYNNNLGILEIKWYIEDLIKKILNYKIVKDFDYNNILLNKKHLGILINRLENYIDEQIIYELFLSTLESENEINYFEEIIGLNEDYELGLINLDYFISQLELLKNENINKYGKLYILIDEIIKSKSLTQSEKQILINNSIDIDNFFLSEETIKFIDEIKTKLKTIYTKLEENL